MNKTVIFVTFALVVILGFAGYVVLLALDPTPDPGRPDRVITALVLLLGLLSTAAGQFYMLGKQGEKLEKIEKQTNGNLTAEKTHNAALTAQLVEHGIPPSLPPVTGEIGVLAEPAD